MGEHVGHISDEAVFEVLKWGLLGLVAVLAPFLKKNGVKRIAVRGGWSAFLVFLFFSQVIGAITYHQKSGFDNGVWFAVTIFGTIIYGLHFFMFNSNWIFALEDKIRDWWTNTRELAQPDYKPKTQAKTLSDHEMIENLDSDYGGEESDELINRVVKRGEPIVEALIQALHHPRPNVQANAALALGRIGDERAIEPLIEAMSDKGMLSMAAPIALGRIGRSSFSRLKESLKSSRHETRMGAIAALGYSNDGQGVEILSEMLTEWVDTHRAEGRVLFDTAEALFSKHQEVLYKSYNMEERIAVSKQLLEETHTFRQKTSDYLDIFEWFFPRHVGSALANVANRTLKKLYRRTDR